MTDALGDHTTYTYSSSLLQSVTDALNHTTTYSYDADRRLSTTTDALNHVITSTYDANGNPQTTVDSLGHMTTTIEDVMGRETGTIDALGGQTTITYDVSGLELTITDEMGLTTSLVYDSAGQGLVVETVVGMGSGQVVTTLNRYDNADRLTGTRDALGSWTTYQYDGVGRLLTTTDALGDTTQSDYDLAGQQTASRDAMGHWTTYSYNARGEQVQMVDNAGDVTTMAYDAAGNQTAVIDPLNHVTTYTYDGLNRQTVVTDALNHAVTTTYDAVGNVSTTIDANGNTTSYSYDAVNQQTVETDAVGSAVQQVTRQSYDAVGNAITSTDGNGGVTTYSYDALDRQTTVTDPLNHTVTTTYDAVGDVLTTTDALGKVTTNVYDVLHQQVATTDPLGHTTTSVLDAAGDTTASIDALGNVTVNIVDALGRSVGTIDALGNVTLTVLDPTGGTRAVIDSDGNETDYVLDSAGRVTETITPTGTTTTVYDAASRVTSVTDADGRVIQYLYDNDDRETGEVWKSSAGATVNVVTYSYDNNDNTLTAADTNGTVTYTYDALDRVQSYTNVFGQVLTYSYDGNDNVTLRTDSLGGTLTYVYDNSSRLTSEQFSGTGATGTVVRIDFGYDARNEQTSITWFSALNGTGTVAYSSYAFDDAGRLTGITNKNGSNATLSYYDYAYDNADRVSSQTWWSEVGTTVYAGTSTYSYDAANQLLTDSTATYSYDANGNRTMTGYATGTNNETTSDGVYTYSYDAVGNLTEKSKGSGLETWYYGYDNANELTSVRETSNGTTSILQLTYTYDVEGHRVQEQVWQTGGSTVTTRFAYDGDNVWADLDGSNNLLARYLYGDGANQILTRTVASGANAGVWAYLTDNQGSIRDLVNWSGQVQDHLDYSGFGVVTESNASIGDRNKYDGYQYEVTTGLYYDLQRWYNPSTGTWQTQDPIGFAAGDTNLYRYVANDPTNAIDPTGLSMVNFVTGEITIPKGVGLGKPPLDLVQDLSDYFAGAADALTGGASAKFRRYAGYDDVVDRSSDCYRVGGYAGQGAGLAISVTCPPAGRVLNGAAMASGAIDAGEAALNGDPVGVAKGVLAVGLARMRVSGNACAQGVAGAGQSLLTGYGIVNGAQEAIDKFGEGDYIGGVLATLQTAISAYHYLQSCFAAGTPLLTPDGSKPIEQFQVGDLLLSRSEFDPDGPVEAKVVEEVFVRTGRILHLHVGGQLIRTTPEHPFWVNVKGWVPAGELRIGDMLPGRDGCWVVVEDLLDTGDYETVYNVRVADWHTYFVGCLDWGLSVWAHNADYRANDTPPTLPPTVIVQRGQVRIEHYYHGGHDHGPAHLHIYDGRANTKIGAMGRPGVFPSDPELTPGMRALVDANQSLIRKSVNKINRWIKYMRQVHGGIQQGS